MSDVSTVAARLTATLDRLEALAKRATPAPWSFSNASDVAGNKGEFRAPDPHNGFLLVGPWCNDADIALIAAFGPDRVLAVIAKARKVIQRHVREHFCGGAMFRGAGPRWCTELLDEAEAWGVSP